MTKNIPIKQTICQMPPILLCKSIFATTFLLLLSATFCLAAENQTNEVEPVPPKTKTSSTLSMQDCKKCHSEIVGQIERLGKAHRDKISCTDCHNGHPPAQRDVIPLCSKCHQDSPHFNLTGCLDCHTNPHTPLEIALTRTITVQCTTCHFTQIKELQDNYSIHTTLDCTACHTSHGLLPECFACHGPHLVGMTNKDCHACHKPHMPLVVSYGPDIPTEFCGSCHTQTYEILGNSHAKHRLVSCAQCHEAKHKMIPKCQKCHQLPHDESIHAKFPECGSCHGIAHDLKLNKTDLFLQKI